MSIPTDIAHSAGLATDGYSLRADLASIERVLDDDVANLRRRASPVFPVLMPSIPFSVPSPSGSPSRTLSSSSAMADGAAGGGGGGVSVGYGSEIEGGGGVSLFKDPEMASPSKESNSDA